MKLKIYNIEKIERENKYFQFNFYQVNLYSLIRLHFVEYLLNKNSVIMDKKITANKLKIFFGLLYSLFDFFSLAFELLFCKKNKIICVSDTSNRMDIEIGSIDYYFQYYLDNFSQTILLEFPNYNSNKFRPYRHISKKQIFYMDILYLFEYVGMIILTIPYKTKVHNWVSNISLTYENRFNIKFTKEFKASIINETIRLMSKIFFLKIILSPLINGQKIIIKSSYSPIPQILLNLLHKSKIFEQQHGHIYNEHSGYRSMKEFRKPNTFFSFSQYYDKILKNMNYIKSENVGCIPIQHYIEKYARFNKKVTDTSYKILIISQQTVIDTIINFIKDSSVTINDNKCEVWIKLHPRGISEYDKYKNSIGTLSNFIFTGNLLDLIPQFDIIIGVYSSGLIDATYFNKPIYLIKSENNQSSYLKDLIKRKLICGEISNINEAVKKERTRVTKMGILDPIDTEKIRRLILN